MFGALVRRSFARHRALIAALAVLLSAFQVLDIVVAYNLQKNAVYSQFAAMVPAFIQEAMGGALVGTFLGADRGRFRAPARHAVAVLRGDLSGQRTCRRGRRRAGGSRRCPPCAEVSDRFTVGGRVRDRNAGGRCGDVRHEPGRGALAHAGSGSCRRDVAAGLGGAQPACRRLVDRSGRAGFCLTRARASARRWHDGACRRVSLPAAVRCRRVGAVTTVCSRVAVSLLRRRCRR